MIPLIFTKQEITLLEKIEKHNKEEMLPWILPNKIFPFVVVSISLICYLIFKEGRSLNGFINIFLNGSLPLIALNRVSTIGLNLFKWNRQDEIKRDTKTESIRIKISEYSKYLVIFIVVLYVFQVINIPFSNIITIFLQFLACLYFIYLSLEFSKYSYLLQERMVERTTGDDISDEVKDNKKRLNEKYGD